MTDMNEKIRRELRRIEKEEHVRILYACESGSRAWGFPSQDSDYDVRFIYVRPVEWYLSIFEKRDVIERPISDMLDIHGWDLKKALRLFLKSNPPLMEWLQSPMVYMEEGETAERIRALSPFTFSPKSSMYHYLHMAKGNYRDYLQGDQVKIKKYFYVLRPILACAWIEQFGSLPPIEFGTLVKALIPEGSELGEAIEKLLARKKAGEELDMEPRIGPINGYLEAQIIYYEQLAAGMPSGAGDLDSRLDGEFRLTLQEVWGKEDE
ncbi:hypothetical protein DCC85_04075 [Paenibacillus sp. CAA11]|uniref:nucleotidyltransferase domain-containing protein n=1 Tax=Paenibacillus sp. CAA11 TaxID=1532905 RepID=UPI000D36C2AB|nr:nucleotidyltransferase domain-containing protein [Paenibacillus sp. CAA11]AWB43480.1 hypothetical protein DCC85_04075 [Paenibacillus sp. CAA11]